MTIQSKAEHVRNAKQTRAHECHWPGCNKQVPPALWGCKTHWYMLPAPLRTKLWRVYRPGQEDDLSPSDAYLEVAREIHQWIEANR